MEQKNGNGNGHTASGITATEIRDKFQIPYSRINHYTDLGLFSIVKKSGNIRIYDRREIEDRYQIISKLASEGYPLKLIRKKILGLINDELL